MVTLTRDDRPLADLDVPRVAHEIAQSISPAFEGVLSPGTVERCVAETLVELAGGATVVDYLRLLTWRVVNERLREVAPAQAPPPGRVPEVLLVAGAEPALGVAAASMLDELAGGRVRIRVAGATDVPLPAGLAGALRAMGLQV
ncbi:MAG: three-helix bundle dimerization domain-containing protein, partial [Actinomycetota bacterium]